MALGAGRGRGTGDWTSYEGPPGGSHVRSVN